MSCRDPQPKKLMTTHLVVLYFKEEWQVERKKKIVGDKSNVEKGASDKT